MVRRVFLLGLLLLVGCGSPLAPTAVPAPLPLPATISTADFTQQIDLPQGGTIRVPASYLHVQGETERTVAVGEDDLPNGRERLVVDVSSDPKAADYFEREETAAFFERQFAADDVKPVKPFARFVFQDHLSWYGTFMYTEKSGTMNPSVILIRKSNGHTIAFTFIKGNPDFDLVEARAKTIFSTMSLP